MIIRKQTWDILSDLILNSLVYTRDAPPGMRFRLDRDDESNFAQLNIYTYNVNSYAPHEMRHTRHEFIVPVATYNREAWIRWVADKIKSVEIHEFNECFLVDGVPVYAHHHGNGWDPYVEWFRSSPEEQAKAPGDD